MDPSILLGAGLFIALIAFAVAIVVAVFYFLTLMNALSRCHPRNRLMEPGLVWLGMIPLFNIVWAFFNNLRVPDSLKKEFRDRGMDDGSDYGRGLGLTMAILGVAGFVIGILGGVARVQAFAILNNVLGLAAFVLWIIFWVKIAGYSSRLAAPAYDDRAFDDRDYDRPNRDDRGTVGDAGASDAYRQDDRNRIQ